MSVVWGGRGGDQIGGDKTPTAKRQVSTLNAAVSHVPHPPVIEQQQRLLSKYYLSGSGDGKMMISRAAQERRRSNVHGLGDWPWEHLMNDGFIFQSFCRRSTSSLLNYNLGCSESTWSQAGAGHIAKGCHQRHYYCINLSRLAGRLTASIPASVAPEAQRPTASEPRQPVALHQPQSQPRPPSRCGVP